ncbi:hypothetical protein AB4305_16010 [Nocardia sp. 2YAB30]
MPAPATHNGKVRGIDPAARFLPYAIRALISGRFRGRHGCGSVTREEML